VRRALDLALALPALPFLAAIVGTLAALVWWCDGRPVFFSQPRVGKGGRRFRIWKLRTMTLEADVAQRKPTRLGAWLRHRGLDEIPQVFNVLIGDMRLVGPRPLEPAHAERLVAQHPPFAQRFEVAPGLTGLSQVCQASGVELTARLDAHYARTSTALDDVRILAGTLWINVVGKKRGRWRIPEVGAAP